MVLVWHLYATGLVLVWYRYGGVTVYNWYGISWYCFVIGIGMVSVRYCYIGMVSVCHWYSIAIVLGRYWCGIGMVLVW